MMDVPQIRCAVADDHPACLMGLRAAFAEERDIHLVAEATDGDQVLRVVRSQPVDVVLLDLLMPRTDGLGCCRRLLALDHPPAVILYTGLETDSVLEQALEAGARGLVLKSGPIANVVHAVRVVAQGHPYIDGRLTSLLLDPREKDAAALSGRERDIVRLLAGGMSTTEVAGELFLSPATIRSYAENAMHKLEATNRVQAVAKALRLGLVT
jgi:DNA-binding NarL/FixJ family response regulator